jgi:hypothetical protein
VFIPTGDPQEFYQPVDYTNERWLELSLFPGRRVSPDRHPNIEDHLPSQPVDLFSFPI